MGEFADVRLEGHGPFDFFGRAVLAERSVGLSKTRPRRSSAIVVARACVSTRGGLRGLRAQESGHGDHADLRADAAAGLRQANNLLVLVEGLDYDYTAKDEEFSTNSRSDVIWAVNLDFANKRIYELSIPRDMIATMPNGSQAKINQAQSDGGVKEAKSVIAQWLGIPGIRSLRRAAHRRDQGVRRRDRRRRRRRQVVELPALQDRLHRRHARLRRQLGPPAHPFQGRPAASRRRARRRVHALPPRLVQRSVPDHAPAASAARACRQAQRRSRQYVPAPRRSAGGLPQVRADRLHRLRAALDRDVLSGHARFGDRQQPGSVHRRRQSCRATATRSCPTRGARASRRDDADRAARAGAVARCDGAGGDSRRRRCASTSRTAAASAGAARRVATVAAARPASRSATSATPIVPTTRRPRSTSTRPSRSPARKVREALPQGLRKAVVVPDPSPSGSPAATATHDQRRHRDRRQRSRENHAGRCCRDHS